VLPLEYCKKILNKGERKCSEEEVKQIREFLYFIGQIEINNNEVNYTEDERNTIL
jgi:hypothetical protein